MKCLHILCLLLHLVKAFDYSWYSLSEFKKLFGNQSYLEYKPMNETVSFGAMKILKFGNETSLFVGGRSSIYRINIETLELLSKTDDNLPLWDFEPIYDRSFLAFRSKFEYDPFNETRMTLDGCLSYSERIWVDNVFDHAFNHSNMLLFTKKHPLPTVRHDYPMVRFTKQLETFVCGGSFIRGLEKVRNPENNNESVLWACGTFGSFPRAYLFDPDTLKLVRNGSVDTNLPTCARWPDEPMVTKVASTGDLYIGTGWGLYRPDKERPDVVKNNSTMLYSDWRMLSSGHSWFSRLAMILGRDVTFIPRVMENDNYLYFFGREVSPQFSYINTMANEITQSFMLRICKNDVGFRYTADEVWPELEKIRGNLSRFDKILRDEHFDDPTSFSFTSKAYDDLYHVPTKHFVSAKKFPFGCYLKRYDGAQSQNRFWGERNIMYFNRVADVEVFFDWVDERDLYMSSRPDIFDYYLEAYVADEDRAGVDPNAHIWQRMYGAFSSSGFRLGRRRLRRSRASSAHGAICQFQLSEWKTDDLLNSRKPPPEAKANVFNYESPFKYYNEVAAKNVRQFPFMYDSEEGWYNTMREYFPFEDERSWNKNVSITRQVEEFMAMYGGQKTDFYSHFTRWFQGGQAPGREGLDFQAVYNFTDAQMPLWSALKTGQCLNESATRSLTKEEFLKRMKLTSTAWPTEWDTWASKAWDAVFHMNPMNVAGDNASFVAEGVEFAKMFVLKNNFTKYRGGNGTSPLVYMVLVTTDAEVYLVVMCDLVSVSTRRISCEMFNTDQPYLTKSFNYMRGTTVGISDEEVSGKGLEDRQFRISSLLSVWRFSTAEDEQVYPHSEEWQTPLLKDAVYEKSVKRLILSTSRRIMSVSLTPSFICSSYRTCVHCASDPHCAWIQNPGSNGSCTEYKADRTDTQDVLHRGAKCQRFIKPVHRNVTWQQQDLALRLKCSMASFYRGIISWSVDSEFVDSRNSLHKRRYRMDERQNTLLLLPAAISSRNSTVHPMSVRCIGTSMDDDSSTILAFYSINLNSDPQMRECTRQNKLHEQVQGLQYCTVNKECKKL